MRFNPSIVSGQLQSVLALLCAITLMPLNANAGDETAPPRMSGYHILTVGINTYQNVTPLQGAANDATALAKVFQERGRSTGEPRILLNENATKAAILAEFRRLEATVPRGASVMIAFAGHGKRLGNSFIFAPTDFNPSNVAESGLSANEFKKTLSVLTVDKQCRVVLILDSCHAGTIRKDLSEGWGAILRSKSAMRTDSTWLSQLGKGETSGLILLASSIPSQFSQEIVFDAREGPHGVLTASLLQLFNHHGGIVRKGEITLSEIRYELPICTARLGSGIIRKVPGTPKFDQDFVVASSISIPETTAILDDSATHLSEVTCQYEFHTEHPRATGSIEGEWKARQPVVTEGRISVSKSAAAAFAKNEQPSLAKGADDEVIAPPVPLRDKDGNLVMEEFELILSATAKRNGNVQAGAENDRPTEEGTFEVRYSSPTTKQMGYGRYTYGEKGQSVLRLIYDNGTDEIRVAFVGPNRLTLETERVWSVKPSRNGRGTLVLPSYRVKSETFTYDMVRVK